MTMGEYAQMILYEQWIDLKNQYSTAGQQGNFELTVVTCNNYTHKTIYELPVNPSPNLNSITGIYWYPSTCFFEGTVLSEGRGTPKPFQIFGHPSLPKNLFSFTPESNLGAKEPKLKGKLCYGWDISDTKENKLAGNATLMQQIKDGKSEDEIRKSWQPDIQKFKAIRKKYLLYKDFE